MLTILGWVGISAASAHGANQEAATSKALSNLGFDLHILLSKQATYELGRRKEGVVVSASYFGVPTVIAQPYANDVGLIDLGRETLLLRSLGGPVRVTGETVNRKKLGWLKGPPMVNVNVFTARRSGPNNLITCDIVDGPVARVAAQKTTLVCGLIDEKRNVAVYPR